jgi:hypothetical protein
MVTVKENGKNKKSCILTATGRDKLNKALNKKYGEKYTYKQILEDVNSNLNIEIDREVISQIINDPQKSSRLKTIDNLFSFLDIDLEESDYDNPVQKERNNHITLSPPETIKQAVKELNYLDQIRKFTDFLDLENYNKVGAFLIYGKPQYGQRWLINRLCFEVPDFTKSQCETLPLKRYRHDISRLWEDLARRFGSNSNSPKDIVDAIYQHWQSQTIIICFSHFNCPEICGQYLNYLISNFWQPLVNKTGESKSSQYFLLLFFLDESECNKDVLGMPIIQNFDINTPWNICELNELSCFTNEHLKRWLGIHKNIFEPVITTDFQTILHEVSEYDLTTPEDILDKVCSYFNLTWYDIETTLPIQIKER